MTESLSKFMEQMKVRFHHHFPKHGQLKDTDILLLMMGDGKKWRRGNLCPEYLPSRVDKAYLTEQQKFLLEALDVAAESIRMANVTAKRMGKQVQHNGSMKRLILSGLRGGYLEWLRHATRESLLQRGRRSSGSERSLSQIFEQIQKHRGG
jgi:hypothetical protein